jgi:hypothetical protein
MMRDALGNPLLWQYNTSLDSTVLPSSIIRQANFAFRGCLMIPMFIGLRQPEAQHTAPVYRTGGNCQFRRTADTGCDTGSSVLFVGNYKSLPKTLFQRLFCIRTSEAAHLGFLAQMFCFEPISRSYEGPSKTIAIWSSRLSLY